MVFENARIDLGDVRDGDIKEFTFKVKDSVQVPFERLNPGCHCTTVTDIGGDRYVKGILDITKAGYFNGNQVHKVLTVNFEDGLPEYIADPKSPIKRQIINPNKMRANLTLVATRVDVEVED